MSSSINLPEKLQEQLEKIAEAEQLSVQELAEIILSEFLSERENLESSAPSDLEIATIKASIEEANQPSAKWFDDDEADQELNRLIAQRRAAKNKGQGAA